MPSFFAKLLGPKRTTGSNRKQFDSVYGDAISAAQNRDFERAIGLFDQAIALDPLHAEARYKQGNALKDSGRLEAAVASYDEAIALKPDFAHAFCNRGAVQHRLGLLTAALSSYDRAIALDANDPIVHCNRALLLQDCSRWEEAIIAYDRAIALDPNFSDAQYNRSLTALYLGDFETGWRGFEWRWRNAQRLSIGAPRQFTQPLWLGEASLAGRTLLLYSEGGLGDTLQFCRYASLCAALGATVLLEVQPPVLELLNGLEGVSRVLPSGAQLPAFDYQCPLMSLPLAFHTTLATIPAPTRYLHADPVLLANWRTRLGERRRPRIGLIWSGNPNSAIDQRRSIRLAAWAAHLPPELEYFCLQKDVRREDREALALNSSIRVFGDADMNFSSTAALCECMDLVLSVDTSIAHLSGALGRPTWLLLSFTPDWRFMLGRNDCPWYPTMNVYRQRTAGEWTEVFERVEGDLRRHFGLT